ncbi:GNAT family N-acetyltransferase [Halobacteriales archaeon SW_7_68_16]|nr:MAG: GNAT family N-acetyltransferase [Halobacteriales archaeon SW_7_68_16]
MATFVYDDDVDVFPVRIETERLELTAVERGRTDPREIYDHTRVGARAIDEITAYVTWDPHESLRDAIEFVDGMTEKREEDRGTEYVIRPKPGEDGAGEFAGVGGIGVDWDRRLASFGFWLRKRFWGRGYSGERAAAFVELAFEDLDLDIVEVFHFPDNDKSESAIAGYVEAHGGRREGLLRHHDATGGEVTDQVRYTITAEEYRESRD